MDGGNAKGLSGTILACSNNLKIIHLLGTIYGKKTPSSKSWPDPN